MLPTTLAGSNRGPLHQACISVQGRRRVLTNREESLQVLATDNLGRSSPRRIVPRSVSVWIRPADLARRFRMTMGKEYC
jgi:hypothetical protein